MTRDVERIDEAVLERLFLDRLHAKRYISNPVRKAKLFVLTQTELRESERLFKQLFGAD